MSEDEVDLIISRLRDELGASTEVGGNGSAWAARAQAERFWAVTADRPLLSKPGSWGRLRGVFLVPVKVVLRKLMRWYLEPALAQQREFNSSILRALTHLSEHVETAISSHGAPERLSFQARVRGSSDLILARQSAYVDDFADAAPVLDIGCGRGEFLGLLREAGIESKGIDLDATMIEHCRREGLDVERVDAIGHLEGLDEGSLGGIFCAHVAECLAPTALVRLLALAATKLRSGGLLIVETPNPRALLALSRFFADPMHLRLIDPETLDLLARQAGFRRTEIRFLNEPSADERLQPVWLPDDPEHASARPALASNIDRLNAIVFDPQDFALVARA